MRHVTDGELHAFLDGGLELLPGDRGDEIRSHISGCSVCQERLQDEELIRAEAKEILGNPVLDQAPLPTFEELRERAAAPASPPKLSDSESDSKVHYRGPLRGIPVAWAATIILALGVGWMGGQVWRTLPEGSRPGEPGPQYAPVERPEAQLTDLRGEAATVAEEQEEMADPARRQAGSDAGRARVEEVSRNAGSPPEGPTVPAGAPLTESKVLEAEAAPPNPENVAADAMSMAAGVGASKVGASVDSFRAKESVFRLDAVGVNDPSELRRSVGMEQYREGDMVTDSLENSLAIPGLQVVSIEWEERVPGEKALLIRQFLPPADTLELRYLGMLLGTNPGTREEREVGASPEETAGWRVYSNVLEASLSPGWNQVVMESGRGLLVARGSIPEGNLKALLKTLR